MLRHAAVVLGSLALSALMIGCESDRVVEWADGEQPRFTHARWWHYQYVYHPHDQVYFEPYTRVYHWYDEGEWRSGMDLPDHFVLDAETAIVVKHRTDNPPFHHQRTIALGGPMSGHHPVAPADAEE